MAMLVKPLWLDSPKPSKSLSGTSPAAVTCEAGGILRRCGRLMSWDSPTDTRTSLLRFGSYMFERRIGTKELLPEAR